MNTTHQTRSERGASAVEYGLLIAGIAAVIVAGVLAFGGTVHGLYGESCSTIEQQATHHACADATP
jgi:pilus assembly protein Flp/PilA